MMEKNKRRGTEKEIGNIKSEGLGIGILQDGV